MQVFAGPTQLRTTYDARAAHRHGECHRPLGAAHAEPDNMRTLTAVNDMAAPARRFGDLAASEGTRALEGISLTGDAYGE